MGLVLMGILFNLYSCKSAKTNKSSNQNSSVDTIGDRNRLSFYKGDTVAYINHVVKNQDKYIGKPLSVLLKDLDVPIHTFYYSPNSNNRYKITNLILETKPYGAPSQIINGENRDLEIGIGWQTFVPTDSIDAITKANGSPDSYKWSEKAKAYFGKQIVGNLWLRNYMKR